MRLLTRLNSYLAGLGVDYAICGGRAIDLFLGRQTRPHKDIDVAVYWEARDQIVQRMLNDGWNLYEPCGCEHLHRITAIEGQKRLKSNIWCVKADNPHYRFTAHGEEMYTVSFDGREQTELDFVEFLFNYRRDDSFIYARDDRIKRGLGKAVLRAGDIPYLAPELVLLYKSTAVQNAEYQLDFKNALPKMSCEQVMWLNRALTIVYPDGHSWLKETAE